MSDNWYILDDDKNVVGPVEVKTYIKWSDAGWDPTRNVAQWRGAKYKVSTVFLGIAHGVDGGEPIVFETMVFKAKPVTDYSDIFCRRYTTYKEALETHDALVEIIKEIENK